MSGNDGHILTVGAVEPCRGITEIGRSLAVLEYNETSCADKQLVPLAMARAFASRPA